MEKTNYVYIVVHSWTRTYDSGDFVKVFNAHKKAQDFAKQLFDEIVEGLEGYEEDYEIEEELDSYSVYKDGYYIEDHDEIMIYKTEIN